VVTVAEDYALLGVEGLAVPLRLAETAALTPGAGAAVALRPEKIALRAGHGEFAPAENHAEGMIGQILYLGSESQYEVTLASGRRLKVLRPNQSARDAGDFGVGAAVSLSWPASAPVLLPV